MTLDSSTASGVVEWLSNAPIGISARGFTATLNYDSANGLLANLAVSNGLSCAYAYDKMDRLTGLSWKNASNEVLRRQNYSYTLGSRAGSYMDNRQTSSAVNKAISRIRRRL